MAENAVIDAPSAGAATTTAAGTGASPTPGSAAATDEQILGIGADEAQPGDAQPAQPEATESGAGGEQQPTQPNDAAAQQTQAAQQQGRGLTPEVRDFFKAHPEVRDAYFRSQEYAKLFPDFKTAQLVADHLSRYETPEQFAEDLKGVADLRAVDQAFYSTNPEDHGRIVENLFADSPQSFASLLESVPATLERLAQDRSNPQIAEQAREIYTGMLVRAVESGLDRGRRLAIQSGDQDTATKIEEMAEYLLGRNPWAPESVDEKLARLHEEREQLEAQKRESRTQAATRWVNDANEQVVQEFTGAVKQTVEQLVGRAYSDEAKALLVGEIYRRVHQSLETNAELVAHVSALARGGHGDAGVQRQIVRLVTNQAKRMIPGVAEKVIGAFGRGTLAAHDERQQRETKAAGRVDVTGSTGMDGRSVKPVTPDQLKKSGKYRQLSDDDILEGRG